MTNLPITISAAPAKATAEKKPGNNDTKPAEAQKFGNVLARQVADAKKPAESNAQPPADNGNPLNEAADKEKNSTAENISPPADDMLAALLAQQILNAMPATAVPATTEAIAIADTATNGNIQSALTQATPVIAETGTDKGGKALPASANAKAALKTDLLVMENSATNLAGISKEDKGFANSLKSLDAKDLNASSNTITQRNSAFGELPTSTPQSGISSTLPLTTASTLPASISTAVNQPAWADEFSQKITWMTTQRNQSAELHLNPPQLGPLDVVLNMNGDQASATFTSPHAAVREAIEQALPKLREMLADNGIMLGNATVNDQASKSEQDRTTRNPQTRGSSASPAGEAEINGIQGARVTNLSRHNGLVDTFA